MVLTEKKYTARVKRDFSTAWETAFLIARDNEGGTFVDNSKRHFASKINHEASIDEAIDMLETALREFKLDKAGLNAQKIPRYIG